MKITALLLGLSTSILLSQSQQSDPAINSAQDNLAPTPSATTPGRYQLYAATIPVESAGPTTIERDEKTLFRIDTATGTVWKIDLTPTLIANNKQIINTSSIQNWKQIPEEAYARRYFQWHLDLAKETISKPPTK